MQSSPLRWGILSTARINRALIPPLKKSKRNRIIAVASRNLQSAEAYAAQWQIPRAFGSYEEMLADPEIDVVYISLPNSLHEEWTIRSLEAGKHVLCEKPLALSVGEVDAIITAVEKTGKVAMEGFMNRHHQQTLKVKELVESGAIGNLQVLHGIFSYTQKRSGDVRLDPILGGGSIWDVGCYPISMARYMVGEEPVEVFGWQTSGPTGVDETFIGQLRFPGYTYAQFDCGFRAPYRTSFDITGSDGIIQIPHPYKPGQREKIFLSKGEKVQPIDIRSPELYEGEVENMADAILEGKPQRISLADSRGNVETITALLQSAREKKPIQIPLQ